jgi:hypothetical protein
MNIYTFSPWAIHDNHLQITFEVTSLTDFCTSVNITPIEILNKSNSRYHTWQWRSHNG